MFATNLEAYRPTQAASLPLSEDAVATHSYIDSTPLAQPDLSVESIDSKTSSRTNWRLLDVGLGVLSLRSISTKKSQQQERVEGARNKDIALKKTYVISILLRFVHVGKVSSFEAMIHLICFL